MILFITDVHCRYAVVNRQVEAAETAFGEPVTDIIVLGDLGLVEPFLKRFYKGPERGFTRTCHFIEGNHEDFDRFDRLVRRYADRLSYLPRGNLEEIAGKRFLCIGGVAYMDAHMTPERSVIKPRDIEACLKHPSETVDVVISHDCPRGIGVANTPGFEHYGVPGFEGGERIADRYTPALWFFGHHHRPIEISKNGTRYIGLPLSWQGYAVLKRNGEARLVENTVPVP